MSKFQEVGKIVIVHRAVHILLRLTGTAWSAINFMGLTHLGVIFDSNERALFDYVLPQKNEKYEMVKFE